MDSLLRYKGAFLLELSEGVNISNSLIINALHNYYKRIAVEDLQVENQKISFRTKNSLLRFSYPVEFETHFDKKLRINYRFGLEELSKIAIVIVVFSAFFSKFSLSNFFLFLLIVMATLFAFNIIFMVSVLRRDMAKALPLLENESLTDENYQDWQNDPHKCPACGYEITEFDLHCPDCGIKLKQNRFSVPMDVSAFQDKTIRFHYKKDK